MTHPTPSDRARKAAVERVANAMTDGDLWIGAWDAMPEAERNVWLFRADLAFATFERETPGFAAGVEAKKFNKHGRDANALFRERMGSRSRPTWWAVNALQRAVEFCELYVPNLTPAPPASEQFAENANCSGEGLDADELVEARNLAVALWNKHYREASPNWQPLDDLRGIISQIDNMTAGMARPALEAERAKWEGQVADWLEGEAAMAKGLTAWFWIKEGRFGLWFFKVKAIGRAFARLAVAIRSGAYRQEQGNG